MSEGEKIVTMEKKLIIAANNYRQSSPAFSTAAEFRRDGSTSSGSVSSRSSAQNTPARRDYSANKRGSSGIRGGGGQAYRRQQSGGEGGKGRQGRGQGQWNGGEYYKGIDNDNMHQQYSIDDDYRSEVTKAGLSEEPQPEIGSVQAWGRKKNPNGNSLLGFYYEGSYQNNFKGGSSGGGYRGGYRDGARGYGGGGNGRRYEGGKKSGASSYGGGHRNRVQGGGGNICYNKERFLQANCQFVVRDGANYSIHGIDPDVLVDWELIEQVRVRTYEVQSCPICLYPPSAAKITRCGHIYCWSCILHYLAQDDKSWSKCPICYEAIHEKDLKSVLALESVEYQAGHQIMMRLMKKARGEIQVAPRSEWRGWSGKPCSLQESSLHSYAKLITASVGEVKEILRGERELLEQQLREEGEYTLEGSFVKAALKLLEEREIALDASPTLTTELQRTIDSDGSESDQRAPVVGRDDAVAVNEKIPTTVTTASKPAMKLYRSAFSDDEFEEEMFSGSKFGDGKGQDLAEIKDQGTASINPDEADNGASKIEKEPGAEVIQHQVTTNINLDNGPGDNGGSGKELDCDGSTKSSENHFQVMEQCSSSGHEEDSTVLDGASTESLHIEGEENLEKAEFFYKLEKNGLEKKLSSDGSMELEDNREVAGVAAAAAVVREKDNAFYFYQCEDGQQVYMNPLGKKMIEAQYGSLAQAPDVIMANILELETVSMEEDTRRRYRVLSHLPLTCQFMMAELDLKPPIISADVRKQFAGEMEERARQRQRKEREDRQRARRIEQEENRKLGIDPTVRVVRSDYRRMKTSVQQAGPIFDSSHIKSSPAHTQVIDSCQYSSSPPSPPVASPDWSVGSVEGVASGSGALSFAQMLKAGHQKPPPTQTLARQDWPAVGKGGMVERARGGANDVIDSDGDGSAAPRYEDSWANGIQEALNSLRDRHTSEGASNSGAAGDTEDVTDTVASVGKKKKKIKTVLFSTSMSRHN